MHGEQRVRRPLLAALAAGLLLAAAGQGYGDVWIPLKLPAGERGDGDLAARRERQLAVDGLTSPLRQGRSLPRVDAPARAGADTVRVMALRLAFRTNREPGKTTVPPDGRFMAPADTLPAWMTRVDPPPHDHAYFAAHLRALGEFYRVMSYGQLVVEGDVFPGPGVEPFLLSDPADYGPEAYDSEWWTVAILETFIRTALDSIDAALQGQPDGPRFADYDYVLIFHAGSDYQSDIYGDSPNDLPSFTIDFGEPHPVDGGQTDLWHLLLVPETTTQDLDPGYPVYGALNAVVAHEFGHLLGLMDTYDSWSMWPVVGYWDLMDSGHQIVYGLQPEGEDPLLVMGALPASLSIWHRMLLGWVREADGSLLRPGGGAHRAELTAANLPAAGIKALRLDLSDREYFLLENRQELLRELPPGEVRFLKRDDATGVFQFMATAAEGEEDDAVNSGEYDFFLEQSGLLAWHVDERDFETLYPSNQLNLWGDWHVTMVEADGGQDLGNPYSWNWRGNDLDPFFTGNNTEWGPATTPNTRLYDGSASGLTLDSLVTSPYLPATEAEVHFDSVIGFRWTMAGAPPGLPRDDRYLLAGAAPAPGTLMAFDDPDRDLVWLTYASADGCWLRAGLDAGGEEGLAPLTPLPCAAGPILSSARVEELLPGRQGWCFLTDSLVYLWLGPDQTHAVQTIAPWVTPRELLAPLMRGPMVGAGDDGPFVAWLDSSGALNAWNLAAPDDHRPAADLAALVFPAGGDTVHSAPVLQSLGVGAQRICVAAGDRVLRFDPALIDDAGAAWADTLDAPGDAAGPVWLRALDTDGDGIDELLWIDRDGRVARPGPDGFTWLLAAGPGGGALIQAPAVADLDADGRPELLLGQSDRVHRVSALTGESHAGWPLRLAEIFLADPPLVLGSPLLAADLTGDGASELVLATASGHLVVVDDEARPVLGTPRSLAAAAPLDIWAGDGEVRALTQDGFLAAFAGVPGGGAAEWGQAGGGPGRQGRWVSRHPVVALAAAGEEGWVLYPNPAGERARLHHAALPGGTRVRVELYDIEGQRRLIREATSAADGPFELAMDLRGLAPAVYLCRVEVEGGGRRSAFVKRLGVLR